MLIEFTVGNFLSFKDKRTLSFKAASISEKPENVVKVGSYKLLRSAVVYGANSSGKSNLIKSFGRMRNLISESVRTNVGDQLPYTPFLLSSTAADPTFFEIEFLIEKDKIRYGFDHNREKIINEWLFIKKERQKETALFIRTPDGIGVSDTFEEGKGQEHRVVDNRLFLSLIAQLNGIISKTIISKLLNYHITTGIVHGYFNRFNLELINSKDKLWRNALDFFKKLNLGFNEIILDNDSTEDHSSQTIKTLHNWYDSKGNVVNQVLFDKENNESEGTKKVIDLSGLIFSILDKGSVLFIDELDSKLHPLITIEIIKLFNNPETNPKNAQLFFATHDTNLLSSDLFRRDQIWFTEKDEVEQTDLYSLVEFKMPDGEKVRNDSNYEKNYIRGRYGAIPYIATLVDKLIE